MGRTTNILAAVLFVMSGCTTHVISEEARRQADPTVSFRALLENPDANRGKLVMLGGMVTAVTADSDRVQLEVMQYGLDNTDSPDTASGSAGRFLVNLPPKQGYETFRPGTLVTMVGEVTGTVVKPLSGFDYTYPLLAAKEIHAVERPAARPDISPYGGPSGYGY